MSATKSDVLWNNRPLHKLKKAELIEALETIRAEHLGDELDEIGLTTTPLHPRISIPHEQWRRIVSMLTDANQRLIELNTSEPTCASGEPSEPQN